MDLYQNAPEEDKKQQIKHAAMQVYWNVEQYFLNDVISEVLDELKEQEPEKVGEFDMFDCVYTVDDDLNVTQLDPPAPQEENETLEEEDEEEEIVVVQEEPQPELNLEEEEELHRQYVKDRRNPNTVKKTESVLRKVHRYFQEHLDEERDVLDIPPRKLASLMCQFILGVRKVVPKDVDPETLTADQKYHQPDTLTSYYTGVARYCRENGYPCCIMTDERFTLMKKVLETRRSELKDMGLGNKPNQAVPLSDEDTERCWQTGAFGKKDPRTLQNTIYFLLSNVYGWRGRDEQEEVRWDDLTFFNEGTPEEFLKWNERGAKTRHGNGPPRVFQPNLWPIDDPERCPVRLYKILRSLRSPVQCASGVHFFLTPKFRATMTMKVAFKNTKMSTGSIGKIMPMVKKIAGLTGQIKGHSVRKTCATNLLQQGIPPNIICQLTGHANVNSLNNYACASMPQQKEMCQILVGGKRPAMDSLAPGSSLLKRRSPPSTAAGSASSALLAIEAPEEDLAAEDPDPEEDPAPLELPAPILQAPGPLVFAPAEGRKDLQERSGRLPMDVIGMFSGATIQGSVNVHIHYGNVDATANTQVNNSQ